MVGRGLLSPTFAAGAEAHFHFLRCQERLEVVPSLFFCGAWIRLSDRAKFNSGFLTGPSALFGMTSVKWGNGLIAALKALRHPKALCGAEAPRFHGCACGGGSPVSSKSRAGSTSTSKATDRSVRPTRSKWWKSHLGRRCAGGRDPSTAHDVHYVGVILRSG
jgi:hypothetical protein